MQSNELCKTFSLLFLFLQKKKKVFKFISLPSLLNSHHFQDQIILYILVGEIRINLILSNFILE